MSYLIGIVLALAMCFSALLIGLSKDRAFYPTMLIVIASYYVLFAVMGGSRRAVLVGRFSHRLSSCVCLRRSQWRVPEKPLARRRRARRTWCLRRLSRTAPCDVQRAGLVAGLLFDI